MHECPGCIVKWIEEKAGAVKSACTVGVACWKEKNKIMGGKICTKLAEQLLTEHFNLTIFINLLNFARGISWITIWKKESPCCQQFSNGVVKSVWAVKASLFKNDLYRGQTISNHLQKSWWFCKDSRGQGFKDSSDPPQTGGQECLRITVIWKFG